MTMAVLKAAPDLLLPGPIVAGDPMASAPPSVPPSRASEILQVASTIASIAVAIAAVLTSTKQPIGPVIDWTIRDHRTVFPLVPAILLLCGILALSASLRGLNEMRQHDQLTRRDLVVHPLGFLLGALVLLFATYVIVLVAMLGWV